jgi:hypothetical protein
MAKMGNNPHQTDYRNVRRPLDDVAVDDFPVHTATERPPDGGYGWVCLAACFNINCFTWGVVAVRFKKSSTCAYVKYEGS